MRSFLVLLVCTLCYTRAVSSPSEQSGDILRHYLLLELQNRMDAKDAEINDLRANQRQQDENMKMLMFKISAQDATINDLQKKVNTQERVINRIEVNQKRQETLFHKLHQNVSKLQKYARKCAKLTQLLNVFVQNLMQTKMSAQLQKMAGQMNVETNSLADFVPRHVNISTPALKETPNDESEQIQGERDTRAQALDKRHAGTDLVAFFATLNKHAMDLGVGQNLLFDHVITNIG
ncbi:hypothetical protein DPMN_063861 [Dreissena polymorpha]|uniref:Uncharacterized protein n=1 Tax=Dreissena polymorpha TaxID=45954 RepID=A0A9D4HKK4_DREPO|nr:hypothetical protein DPMN_063861 [Dreissena polymorpha]